MYSMFKFIEKKLEPKPVKVHDLHDNTHVGSAATLDEALSEVVSHDIRSHPHRVYRVCNDFCEPTKSKSPNEIWYGDSWSLGQYMRETGASPEKQKALEKHNASRLFGRPVVLHETDKPDTYDVTFKK